MVNSVRAGFNVAVNPSTFDAPEVHVNIALSAPGPSSYTIVSIGEITSHTV